MAGFLRILLLCCTLVIFAKAVVTYVTQSVSLKRTKGKSIDHQLSGEVTLNSMHQPYMVAIKYNNHYTCSGTILSPTKILTTASCVHSYLSEAFSSPRYWKNVTVYAGSPNLSNGGNVYHIREIKIHDDYTFEKFVHDLAIITLATSIKYSDKQAPIRLPDNDIINDSLGMVSGWGVKSEHSGLGDNLQRFKTTIVTADKCNVEFFNEEEAYVDDDEFCGIPNADNPGFCIGHSGSSMVQEGKIMGIVAWGIAGCTDRNFDVYTNIYKHMEFIKKELLE